MDDNEQGTQPPGAGAPPPPPDDSGTGKRTRLTETARLRMENAELREQVARLEARHGTKREAPRPASFGLSEGARQELEMTGRTTDPYTGETVTRADLD